MKGLRGASKVRGVCGDLDARPRGSGNCQELTKPVQGVRHM